MWSADKIGNWYFPHLNISRTGSFTLPGGVKLANKQHYDDEDDDDDDSGDTYLSDGRKDIIKSNFYQILMIN